MTRANEAALSAGISLSPSSFIVCLWPAFPPVLADALVNICLWRHNVSNTFLGRHVELELKCAIVPHSYFLGVADLACRRCSSL